MEKGWILEVNAAAAAAAAIVLIVVLMPFAILANLGMNVPFAVAMISCRGLVLLFMLPFLLDAGFVGVTAIAVVVVVVLLLLLLLAVVLLVGVLVVVVVVVVVVAVQTHVCSSACQETQW